MLFVLVLASVAFVALSGCIEPPVCGNGVCEIGEDAVNCPQDCSTAVCGNGICEPPETAQSCPQDCGDQTKGDLEATVIDSLTKEPIAGAEVTATSGGYVNTMKTDSKGIALFIFLNPGKYTVTASKEGYTEAVTEVGGVTIKPGEIEKITLELTPTIIEFDEIAIGDNAIEYADRDGIERSVPFAMKLDNSFSESIFIVAGGVFYYRCSQKDIFVTARIGDYLNGYKINLNDSIIQTDEGLIDLNSLKEGDPLYFGGGQFDFSAFVPSFNITVLADGNCEFSSQPFHSADYLRINGVKPLNNTVYYDDDDSERDPTLPLNVTDGFQADTYNYRVYLEKASVADGDIWLILDEQQLSTEKGKTVFFNGTDTTESGSIDREYYWPDNTDFGNDAGDNSFLTAQFSVEENDSTIDVMVDTATDDTVVFPNDMLSYYIGCVYYDDGEYIKCQAMETQYREGDTIKGLRGAGKYAGQEMSINIAAIIRQPTYHEARLELYDAKDNLVDVQTVGQGTYLNYAFTDQFGNYALGTPLRVMRIGEDPSREEFIKILNLEETATTAFGSKITVEVGKTATVEIPFAGISPGPGGGGNTP